MDREYIGGQYSGVQVGVQAVASAFAFGFGCYFWWNSKAQPHKLGEREQKLELCTSLNIYILLFSACVNIQLMSKFDNVTIPNDWWVDILNYGVYFVTCPLENLQIALLANASVQRSFEVVVYTFAMLTTGFFASCTAELELKVAGFFISCWFMFMVIWGLDRIIKDATEGEETLFHGTSYLRKVCVLEIAFWTIFPILWVLGPEGFNLQSGDNTRIVMIIVNQAAKIGFAFYIYLVQEAWSKQMKKEELDNGDILKLMKVFDSLKRGDNPFPEHIDWANMSIPEQQALVRRMSMSFVPSHANSKLPGDPALSTAARVPSGVNIPIPPSALAGARRASRSNSLIAAAQLAALQASTNANPANIGVFPSDLEANVHGSPLKSHDRYPVASMSPARQISTPVTSRDPAANNANVMHALLTQMESLNKTIGMLAQQTQNTHTTPPATPYRDQPLKSAYSGAGVGNLTDRDAYSTNAHSPAMPAVRRSSFSNSNRVPSLHYGPPVREVSMGTEVPVEAARAQMSRDTIGMVRPMNRGVSYASGGVTSGNMRGYTNDTLGGGVADDEAPTGMQHMA